MAIHSTYFSPKMKKLCAKIQRLSKRAYFHNGITKYMTPCIKEHLNEKMSRLFTRVSQCLSISIMLLPFWAPVFLSASFLPYAAVTDLQVKSTAPQDMSVQENSSLGLTLQSSTWSTPTNAFCPLEQSSKQSKNWAQTIYAKQCCVTLLVGTVFCPMNN